MAVSDVISRLAFVFLAQRTEKTITYHHHHHHHHHTILTLMVRSQVRNGDIWNYWQVSVAVTFNLNALLAFPFKRRMAQLVLLRTSVLVFVLQKWTRVGHIKCELNERMRDYRGQTHSKSATGAKWDSERW